MDEYIVNVCDDVLCTLHDQIHEPAAAGGHSHEPLRRAETLELANPQNSEWCQVFIIWIHHELPIAVAEVKARKYFGICMSYIFEALVNGPDGIFIWYILVVVVEEPVIKNHSETHAILFGDTEYG